MRALEANTSGDGNTGVGAYALWSNATGGGNTGIGVSALSNNAAGDSNTAVGAEALLANQLGQSNTAVGRFALRQASGSDNTALGRSALQIVTTGTGNLALGSGSGGGLTSGSANVYIQATAGAASESNTLRIGVALDRAFIDGIRGTTTALNDAVPVVIDANGQLGTVSSSRRTKDNIQDLGPVSRGIFDLRPVQFTYKHPFADGSTPVQYGLIAEEVEQAMPALVAYGADGTPETVKYHVLPTLLLAEVQRLEREREALATELKELRAIVDALLRKGGR
jgi:Chaperone of endosialidase